MVRKQQLADHLGIKALIFQSFRYLLCQNIYSFPILYFFLEEGVVGSKAKLFFCKAHLYTGRTQPETYERDCAVAKRSVGDFRNFSRQKLNVLNVNRGAEDNEALLWFRYEYGNGDGENGQAYAFMTTVYLGGTRYRLPAGETYTFSIYFDCNDVTAYELYCPADPEDASSELVRQDNTVSFVDGQNEGDGNTWRRCTFTADHDGMFVIHPKGYQMQQSWPWWGVPTPPWTPSPDATTPNSEVPELRSLYASGFKFPVIGKDIHFVFPEQLKEWTEGCGDDWDYRFTVDESKGRVAI